MLQYILEEKAVKVGVEFKDNATMKCFNDVMKRFKKEGAKIEYHPDTNEWYGEFNKMSPRVEEIIDYAKENDCVKNVSVEK